MSLPRQTLRLLWLSLRHLPERAGVTAAVVLAIALTICVFLAFAALDHGFRQTLRGAGNPQVAVVLSEGATFEVNSSVSAAQVALLEAGPGLAQRDGQAVLSAESYLVANVEAQSLSANLPVRGLDAHSPELTKLRESLRLVSGRWPASGANEVVIGRRLLLEQPQLGTGMALQIGNRRWQVVGSFELPGSVYESELWADGAALRSQFGRGNTVQTVRALMEPGASVDALRTFARTDSRLRLEVMTEADYFRRESQQVVGFVRYLGWPLALLMALGATVAAANAMFIAVSAQQRMLQVLRAVGFRRGAMVSSVLFETLLIAAVGAALGLALYLVTMDGAATFALGAGAGQLAFQLRLAPEQALQGALLAVLVGLLGGAAPALRAGRILE
jgi:putative ABC transport system permease protein